MSFRTNIQKIKKQKYKNKKKLRKSCDVFTRILMQLAYFYLAESNKRKCLISYWSVLKMPRNNTNQVEICNPSTQILFSEYNFLLRRSEYLFKTDSKSTADNTQHNPAISCQIKKQGNQDYRGHVKTSHESTWRSSYQHKMEHQKK